MKKLVFMLIPALIWGAVFTGCNKQEITVTVELLDTPNVNLIYSVPISGTIFLGFTDTLKANETGKFELKLKITQPSFIVMWDEDFENRVKLLVEPGNNYHISMEAEKEVKITGTNEKGLILYASLPDPGFIEMELSKIVNYWNNNIVDTTSLIFVHQKINELKQSDMSNFRELLNAGEISKSFFDLVQKDRDCYYASMEARFSIIKIYRLLRNETNIEDELLENLRKIYDQYPPNDISLLFSSFWQEYAKYYVQDYQQYIQKDYDSKMLQNLSRDGILNTYYINASKKYLSGNALEFFQASHICFTCYQKKYEKELILLFEQFNKDYPQSEYSKYIKPYIDEIINYHHIIEQPFDQAMLFMDNYETINTLEESIKPLIGKKIYIDVWATWCGPCKREFAHNETLKKMLAENDITQLYISIDRDDYDQQWKDMIKYYHLTGTHIRANQELNLNLMKLFSKNAENPSIAIPWYILIDEQGNIIDERAKSPSQVVSGEKL